MITSVRKNGGLISAKPILISSEICLEITTKSAVFYRLLLDEICPENFDKITPKSTNFSTNLSLKIRRNLTLSSATCQKRQPCQKILYKKPFHLMAVTKISSCWVYAILYKGKVLFILFFLLFYESSQVSRPQKLEKICCSLPLVATLHFIDSALFKPKYYTVQKSTL